MTVQRTPGPWEVGESDTFGTRVQVVDAHLHPQSGHLGARMYVHAQIAICKGGDGRAAAANAAFIVRACNSHYELLTMLKRAREYVVLFDSPEPDEDTELLRQIDAVIAKAEGRS